MSFSEIANNVALMYLLLLIAFFLMYIAFVKKPSSPKSSENS